jgi:hypothetical protein
MKPVIGIFATLNDAKRAVEDLRRNGIADYPNEYSQKSFHDGYERGLEYGGGGWPENVQPSKKAS